MRYISLFLTKEELNKMTFLGKFLITNSINITEVSRKTGINKSRFNQISINVNTNLKTEVLYLISKTLVANTNKDLKKIYVNLNLNM